MFSKGFNASKLKSRLKMTAGRLDIDSAKKTALMKQSMREVAELLAESPPKEEKARLRCESLIRDDNTLQAYEILRLECLLLMERVSLMTKCHECPADLVPTVSDLIFAAPRLEIEELNFVRQQFRNKFGRDFKNRAKLNEGGIVNPNLIKYLSYHPPTKQTVNNYITLICKQYEVDYTPTIELSEADVIAQEPVPEIHVARGMIAPEPAPEIPVATGMKATDDDIIRKMRHIHLDSLEVLPPPPCAPGHNGDNASVTSSSSRSSGGPGSAPLVREVCMSSVSRQR